MGRRLQEKTSHIKFGVTLSWNEFRTPVLQHAVVGLDRNGGGIHHMDLQFRRCPRTLQCSQRTSRSSTTGRADNKVDSSNKAADTRSKPKPPNAYPQAKISVAKVPNSEVVKTVLLLSEPDALCAAAEKSWRSGLR